MSGRQKSFKDEHPLGEHDFCWADNPLPTPSVVLTFATVRLQRGDRPKLEGSETSTQTGSPYVCQLPVLAV